jgi:Ion channel
MEMTHAGAFFIGLGFLAVVLLDAFQTIILPRRPVGRLRITRIFFLMTWMPWRTVGGLLRSTKTRDQAYSIYGPLSLLLLIVIWAMLLVCAFGLIYYGLGTPFHGVAAPLESNLGRLRDCLYASGTTLFTLGLGDLTPASQQARVLVVAEAGVGLGFVALVIGYVPLLYGTFSRREVAVALLDSRAGSPPTAGELLIRHGFDGGHKALAILLAEWERWSAEMLESHVSYPLLCYYRSQHDNQSWLSAITAILDACALLITTIEGPSTRQAQLTFAMARHTLVDLGHVFHLEGYEKRLRESPPQRLPEADFGKLCESLATSGLSICASPDTRARLAAIRLLYEPHAEALSEFLRIDLPLWVPPPRDPSRKPDQWTTVSNLRTPLTAFSDHISTQSAASRLHDDTSHPL